MAKLPHLNDEDRANLVAYLDGELEGPSARALEAKLNTDPQARAEAETFRRAWELPDYLPRPEPSPTFTSRTMNRVSAYRPVPGPFRFFRPWRPWALGIGWAAAVLLAAAGGFAGGKFLSHRKYPQEEQNRRREWQEHIKGNLKEKDKMLPGDSKKKKDKNPGGEKNK